MLSFVACLGSSQHMQYCFVVICLHRALNCFVIRAFFLYKVFTYWITPVKMMLKTTATNNRSKVHRSQYDVNKGEAASKVYVVLVNVFFFYT